MERPARAHGVWWLGAGQVRRGGRPGLEGMRGGRLVKLKRNLFLFKLNRNFLNCLGKLCEPCHAYHVNLQTKYELNLFHQVNFFLNLFSERGELFF